MKILLGLLLVCGGLFALLYYTGMFEFDPAKQAREARAAVRPGMAWDKVADAIGDPKEYRIFIKKAQMIGAAKVEQIKPGPIAPFSRQNIAERLAKETLPLGFTFTYIFSNTEAFTIVFDGYGDVVNVHDAVTMKDLLDW